MEIINEPNDNVIYTVDCEAEVIKGKEHNFVNFDCLYCRRAKASFLKMVKKKIPRKYKNFEIVKVTIIKKKKYECLHT
jgi:hypothetical protein